MFRTVFRNWSWLKKRARSNTKAKWWNIRFQNSYYCQQDRVSCISRCQVHKRYQSTWVSRIERYLFICIRIPWLWVIPCVCKRNVSQHKRFLLSSIFGDLIYHRLSDSNYSCDIFSAACWLFSCGPLTLLELNFQQCCCSSSCDCCRYLSGFFSAYCPHVLDCQASQKLQDLITNAYVQSKESPK